MRILMVCVGLVMALLAGCSDPQRVAELASLERIPMTVEQLSAASRDCEELGLIAVTDGTVYVSGRGYVTYAVKCELRGDRRR